MLSIEWVNSFSISKNLFLGLLPFSSFIYLVSNRISFSSPLIQNFRSFLKGSKNIKNSTVLKPLKNRWAKATCNPGLSEIKATKSIRYGRNIIARAVPIALNRKLARPNLLA